MASSQMFVDMKMNITTYGAHSGLIVHSGIHQGKPSPSLIWPYSNGTQPIAPPSIHLPGTPQPQPQSVPQQQQRPQQSLPWRKEPTPPSSPVYSFRGTDSPPSEFIEPDNIQLNVFHVDPAGYTEPEVRRKESKNEPKVEHPLDALLNDAITTTTTVEVFREKVNPNNPNEYLVLPPVPAHGMDGRPQLLRAVGPDYEKWTNTRTETLINEPVKWRDNIGARTLPKAVSHDGNYASTAQVDGICHPPQLASAYQPAVSRRPQRLARHQSTTNHRTQSGIDREFLDHGDRGGHWKVNNESEAENIYEVARSRSLEAVRRQYESDDSRQRTRTPNDVPSYETPQRISPRRAEATRARMAKNGPRSAKSEEIFHLYETRDAFGNIRAQCESDMKLKHGPMLTSAPSVSMDKPIVSHTSMLTNRLNNDDFDDRINMTATQPNDTKGYSLLDDHTHIPYYTIQNATRSTFPSSENPIHRETTDSMRVEATSPHFNSKCELRNLAHGSEKPEKSTVQQTGIIPRRSQPFFESRETESLSRYAEIRTNSPDTIVPFDLEESNNSGFDDEYLRCSKLKSTRDNESNDRDATSEVDSWQSHSPNVFPTSSNRELLRTLKERTSVSPKNLGSDDSQSKLSDTSLTSHKLLQPEAEYLKPIFSVYEEIPTSKSKTDKLLSDDASDTPNHSLLQESDPRKNSANVMDRATSPQIHVGDHSLKREKGSGSFYSSCLILNIPRLTSQIGIDVPLVSSIDDDGIKYNEATSSNSGSIHLRETDSESPILTAETDLICPSVFTSGVDFENQPKNTALVSEANKEIETTFSRPSLTSISNNAKAELELSTPSNEENVRAVIRKDIPTASVVEDFEGNYILPTSVTPTDLSAVPSRSILHVHRRSTGSGKQKSVTFPFREPELIVSEHRLFIKGIDSDSDTS